MSGVYVEKHNLTDSRQPCNVRPTTYGRMIWPSGTAAEHSKWIQYVRTSSRDLSPKNPAMI